MSAYFVEFNFDWHLLRDSSPIPKQLRNIKHIRIGLYYGFLGSTSFKEPTRQSRRCDRHRFDPWVGKTPLEEDMQPSPVFLPGESHGERNLVSYSPQGPKELDTTETTQHVHMHTVVILHPPPNHNDLKYKVYFSVMHCYRGLELSRVLN